MLRLPDGRADRAIRTTTALVPHVELVFRRGDTELLVIPDRVRLQVDARRAQWWDGQVSLSPQSVGLLPLRPGDLFTPFGTVVEARVGIELLDGTVSTVPFGTYVVASSNLSIGANQRDVSIRLADLSEVVAQYRFEAPLTVDAETDVANVVAAVIASRVGVAPELDLTGHQISRRRTFGLDTNTDPWRELLEVVGGFGMRLYYDRNGVLVLDEPGAPAEAYRLEGPLELSSAFDRRPPNLVVARGEPTDATPPVQAVAFDADPSSPTWVGDAPGGSPYGRVTGFFTSPLLTTLEEAERAAIAQLSESAGAGAGWTVTRPFDPTVDPDDVVTVEAAINNAGTEFLGLVLQVDSVTVSSGSDTVIETRALVDPATFRVGDDVVPDSPPDSPGEVWAVDVFDEPGEWEWDWDAAGQPETVEVLVVAGGGSGGRFNNGAQGGGGAGGLIHDAVVAVAGNVAVVVGAGGAAVTAAQQGNDGDDSEFGALVAVGGGGGGSTLSQPLVPGRNGGSGGGGCGGGTSEGAAVGGAGVPGQGNDGGTGVMSDIANAAKRGGGGGGAGAAGATNPGHGGVGLEFPQFASWGDGGWFAGGGGGATGNGGPEAGRGLGGQGGGGAGGYNTGGTAVGQSGMANTGGGGGASTQNQTSGAGGSGIVLVRYLVAS